MTKTNAMRILDKAKIVYKVIQYEYDDNDLNGITIAKSASLNPEIVFKTLVARGDKTGIIVMCVPVGKEIDLKKAAAESGNKRVEMLHVKELLPTVGYMRGACSPVGMKKKFPTYIDSSVLNVSEMAVSGGMKGYQILLNSKDLSDFLEAKVCDITY